MVRGKYKLKFGEVQLGNNCKFGKYNCIGVPKEQTLRDNNEIKKVIINDNVIIFNNVTIYEGTYIGEGSIIDDQVRIGYDCYISTKTRITHGGYICDRVKIGNDCIIAGFICDAVEIGEHTTVMGIILHEYADPFNGWWEDDEFSPIIGSYSCVGFGAKIIGGITIGDCVYIAAGAIVTKNIPSKSIVIGNNQIFSFKEWRGKKLNNWIQKMEKIRI
jgi:UDP-3-O-[3-hydroxymyristoyl] glucosamine N-acyltransferase